MEHELILAVPYLLLSSWKLLGIPEHSSLMLREVFLPWELKYAKMYTYDRMILAWYLMWRKLGLIAFYSPLLDLFSLLLEKRCRILVDQTWTHYRRKNSPEYPGVQRMNSKEDRKNYRMKITWGYRGLVPEGGCGMLGVLEWWWAEISLKYTRHWLVQAGVYMYALGFEELSKVRFRPMKIFYSYIQSLHNRVVFGLLDKES